MPGSGDPLKRFRAGDKSVSHETLNYFLDAAQSMRNQQRGRKGSPISDPRLPPGLAMVQNNSGSSLDAFGVLGIDSPLILPADNEDRFTANIALTGNVPAVPSHTGKFAVLLEAVSPGNNSIAVVAGLVPVKLNVVDAADSYADVVAGVKDSLTTMSSGTAQIMWKDSGTGSGKWAVVRIGNQLGLWSWCKISTDQTAACTLVQATPCDQGGTVRSGAASGNVRITGHTVQQHGYLTLKAGDVVRYFPTTDEVGVIGIMAPLPIVPTANKRAVLQVLTAGTTTGGVTTGGLIGFDWVHTHS